MNNHTQYLGFAGVDLAKKVMQIHFVTEDGEITDKSTKRAEFLDFFRNRGKCLIGTIFRSKTGLESLRPWDMECI